MSRTKALRHKVFLVMEGVADAYPSLVTVKAAVFSDLESGHFVREVIGARSLSDSSQRTKVSVSR